MLAVTPPHAAASAPVRSASDHSPPALSANHADSLRRDLALAEVLLANAMGTSVREALERVVTDLRAELAS